MKQVQKGFTLIELMIVVAIIGILAAVAIPAYQDYITKAKLAKVSTSVDALKTAIVDYNQNYGVASLTTGGAAMWASLGLSGAPTAPGGEVTGIAVSTDGLATITLTLGPISNAIPSGSTIALTPTFGSTAVTWGAVCSPTGATVPLLNKAFGCP